MPPVGPPPEAIIEFARTWPATLVPEKVRDQCILRSEAFVAFLCDWGVEAVLIYGFWMTEFMGHRVVGAAHVAVLSGGMVYDWTARQFDPGAPVPLVQTVEEFRSTWAASFA